MTSPMKMLVSGTAPPRAVNESWEPFTEPLEASVVVSAHRAVLAIPNRVSLPSMLPPGEVLDAAMVDA